MGFGILVVDNEDRFFQQIEMWLGINWRRWSRAGDRPKVTKAHDLEEAREILARQGGEIGVVVCDMLLSRDPKKCGPELYWFVRAKHPTVRFFIVSTDPQPLAQFCGLRDLPSEDEGSWKLLDPWSREWDAQGWLHRALFDADPPEEG